MKQLLVILVVFTLFFTSCGEIAPPLNETYKDYSKIDYPNFSNINNTTNIIKNISSNIYVPLNNTSIVIASFNSDIFGPSKSGNKLLMKEYAKILDDYDLIAFQEIRDSEGIALPLFVTTYMPGYEYRITHRLGRTNSEEQYAYIYNTTSISIIQEHVYPDANDVFEREPYLARIKTQGFEFIIILIHVKPTDAQEEIKNLRGVVEYARATYNSDEIFITGSLYADCSYYTPGLYLNDYYWLIGDDEDTTTSRTHCAYDRILTIKDYGDNIISCGVDTYVNENITDRALIQAISDHYPVYCEVKL